ncbi:hypothetical protein E2562_004934 [Oryza meyeriana var. granulata]|uniref:Uncharacterized protein n=1 Tax=Oryza meyeriana var. granulata TaxID=110450 RepID=A0A6G1C4P5_9ORYZ|nr:hypothetical protein E2562_004934 [Oryza meyeriana var. granulata]
MASDTVAPLPAPEGNQVRQRTRQLTQGQIDRAIAFERRPFRSKLLDMLDGPGSVINDDMKDRLRKTLAEAARHVEELHDIRMEYKERVLRRLVENGFVVGRNHMCL